MSGNRRARNKMIKIFGKKCFIEELHLRTPEEIEADKARYTGKHQRRIIDDLTYHHILEKSSQGKSTIENGALLRTINHMWFHRLSPIQQRKINQLFQQYKRQFYHRIDVSFDEEVDTNIEINIGELELTDKAIKLKRKGKYSLKKKKLINKRKGEGRIK